MKFSKSVFMVFLFIVWADRSFCQSLLKQVLPPSPDAASLGKFADFPTNLYNGLPQIDIPIWTISQWGMNVPVSLSYHAGGIQVAEVPSWVGSGWTLNAGGVITRSVRGVPDDAFGGFIVNSFPALPQCTGDLGAGDAAYDYFEAAVRGVNDTESDMYYFNFCGRSGKFVFDKSGNIHTVPYQKIKIKKNPTNPSARGLTEWEITTEDGAIFYFNITESQQTIINSFGADAGASSVSCISSWYLKEIRSPRTNQKISFEYGSDHYEYDMPSAETKYDYNWNRPVPCINHGSTSINRSVIPDAKRISKIIFPGGSIEFVAGKYRHDLQGGRVLDKILIKNNAGLIRSYNLLYNYFSANSMSEFSGLGDANPNTVATTYLRLSLKGIQEFSVNNVVGQSYEFTYENNVWLPDRVSSKAVDSWGYYNGKTENNTLIPSYMSASGSYISGAFRQTVEPYVQAGVLKKIKYPTGGYTTFNYESNEVNSSVYGSEVKNVNYIGGGGMCHLTRGMEFDVPKTTTFQLSFTGSKWPVAVSGDCTNQSFDPSYPRTYVYFNVFEVSDPNNPRNMDVLGNNVVGPITIGYASGDYFNTIVLPKGKYQIQARVGDPNGPLLQTGVNVDGMYTFQLKGEIIIQNENKKVGGLRIKETTAYDPVSGKEITKVYKYNIDGGTSSSGKINYVPNYRTTMWESQACSGGSGDVNIRDVEFAVYSSSSYAPLTGMQGGNVGYDSVTVFYGKDANGNIGLNGKTEYYYNSRTDFMFGPINVTLNRPDNVCYNPGRGLISLPVASPVSADWVRGHLLKEINYKNVNGSFVRVDETINTYKDDFMGRWDTYNPSFDVLGAKVDWYIRVPQQTALTLKPSLIIQYYYVPSRYVKLMKTEKRNYDNNGATYVSTISEYQYNDASSDLQKKEETLRDSKGDIIRKEYKYPSDYPSVPVYASMKAGNLLNAVVDEITYRKNVLNKSVKNSYAQVNNLLVSDNIEVKIGNMLPTSKFYFSKYDSYGNLLEQQKSDDVFYSYIYDYAGAYLIAEAVNARYNDIAYTSFESDGKGNWEFTGVAAQDATSPTGNTCYDLSGGTLSKPGLTATTTYKVSYWTKNSVAYTIAGTQAGYPVKGATINGWTYYEHKITGQTTISISGTGFIDEVRLCPATAQMTTFTHQPLVGITTKADINSNPTYYEYDGFGRLILVRDQNRNILKRLCYNYAGQAEDCVPGQ